MQLLINDDYAQILLNALELEFPNSTKSKEATFEAVVEAVIRSKQTRLGPMPTPEVQVSIRNVIREAMEKNKAIPFLVPWGGSKQGEQNIDIAELTALKQLKCLEDRITQFYSPGIDVKIRLEDLTDNILFDFKRIDKTQKYCLDIYDIALKLVPFVDVIPESELMNKEEFYKNVDYYRSYLYQALNNSDTSFLKEIGWSGNLPYEQVNYYLSNYEKLYPDLDLKDKMYKVATYFACSLTRKKMNGISRDGDFIKISFTQPIPGVSKEKTVFYRTVPEKYTNLHYAPWMSKGYFRVNGNVATPAIARYNETLDFIPQKLIYNKVVIESDYVIIN